MDRINVIAPDAEQKFSNWLMLRGGVTRWKNINLSNPDAGDIFTPVNAPDGTPTPKPNWGVIWAENILDLRRFRFSKDIKEVKRFHVAVRRSSGGLMLKLTDASTRKVRKNVARLEEKLGHGNVTYHFDYNTQECVLESIAWED